VQNVGTALAVYNAVVHNEPLISRMVTVSGEAVSEPGIYRVLIGTPISHLLSQAGWKEPGKGKVIHGGPMMGYPLADAYRPISKITNCIIAATPDELPPLPAEQACIRCGKCAEVCPVQLLPQQLYWFSRAEEFDKAEQFKIHDCIECGLCAYVCPSYIPLVDYYRFAKAEIKTQAKARIKSDRSKEKFDARNERLEQERLEKERIRAEKAKARAEAKKAGKGDAKSDAVAAALARVKAKKAAQSEDGSPGDNP
jgi:electron transport complex protein RnfC